MVVSTKKPPPG